PATTYSRSANIVAKRLLSASSAIRCICPKKTASCATMTAGTRSVANAANAFSISCGLPASIGTSESPAFRAASCALLRTDRRIGRTVCISEKSDAGYVRHDRRQQLQLLGRRVIGRACQSGHVAAGTCEAHDKAVADRIGRVSHDDRNRDDRSLQ